MCLSFAGQFIFGVLMVIAFGLTTTSMFLPGLQQLAMTVKNSSEDLTYLSKLKKINIFEFLCPSSNITSASEIDSVNICSQWFHKLESWEKVVVIFMCLSMIAEVITIIWTVIAFFGCCCKKICIVLLPVLALFVTIFLATGIAVFAVNNRQVIDETDFANLTKNWETGNETSHRFYLACGALATAIVDVFIGFLNLCLLKSCC